MIATENGYNLYVGGNGGVYPVHAQLLAIDIDKEAVLKYLDMEKQIEFPDPCEGRSSSNFDEK